MKFKDKVALVTGGANGIGRAVVNELASAGARVALADINAEGDGIARNLGGNVTFFRHDISSDASWAEVVSATEHRFGFLNILINCAGVFSLSSLMQTTDDIFERLVKVNQFGCFYGIRAVIDSMRRAGGGSIVNVVTGGSLKGIPGMFSYCTSKWAVRGMTRCAALDLAQFGIRVNAIHPGAIDTDMIKANGEALNRQIVESIPLKRMGRPEEVASAIVFLASDSASYITGADLVIDGGLMA